MLLNNLLLVAKLETRVNVAMKIIVIGAGASLEQWIRLGVDKALRSPLIGNFGATLWTSNLALPESLHEYMALSLIHIFPVSPSKFEEALHIYLGVG